MHIKNIIIQNFRSYKDQTFSTELHPKHNVIIGKNGSGKSNFFAAVQFVLSEKYSNLRKEDRTGFFHNGAGAAALFVSVEIVFDNSDGRIVLPAQKANEPVVKIRRTMGKQHDEYRVNDRKYTGSEVRQLLESAGFSASNPYYIVEQGKIIGLTQLTDEERYDMLKDVAGTGVYESRRAESKSLLEDTAQRSEKIDDAIAQLDEKLKTLQEEQQELRQFQEADVKRRSLEYAIHTTELNSTRKEIERLEAQYGQKANQTEAQLNRIAELEDRRAALAAKAAEAARRVAEYEQQLAHLERERTVLEARRNDIALRDDDTKEAGDAARMELKSLQTEQKELAKSVDKTRAEYVAKKKKFDAANDDMIAAQSGYQDASGKLDALQAKRGRKAKFSTVADRDKWIKGEIEKNELQVKRNKDETARLEKETKDFAAEHKKLQDLLKAKMKEAEKATTLSADGASSPSAGSNSKDALLKRRDQLGAERRQLWAQVNEQEKVVKRKAEELERHRTAYKRAVRYDIRQGLESLDEALNELSESKIPALRDIKNRVHGRVYQLFQCDQRHETAVEVTVGNAMFNVVVDNFDTSTMLLEHMNRKKLGGRVTFFPLDTCREREAVDPRGQPNTQPLVDTLRFDKQRHTRVMYEIFGRTLLSHTLEDGARAAKALDADVVTTEGDQFSRRGAVTGGFLDPRNMKLPVIRELARAESDLRAEKHKHIDLVQQAGHLELQITQVMQVIDASNAAAADSARAADDCRSEIRLAQEAIARVEMQKEQCERSVQTLHRSSANIGNVIGALQAELKSAFGSALTPAEAKELESLQGSIGELRRKSEDTSAACVQLNTEVTVLKDTLHHIDSRLHTVTDRVSAINANLAAALERHSTSALKTINADIEQIAQRIAALEKMLEDTVVDRKKFEEDAQAASKDAVAAQRDAQDGKDDATRFHNNKQLLTNKKLDAQDKIRKLGVIPDGSDKYLEHGLAKLMQLLKGANAELKKFEHVNKKALDQFTAMNDLREKLAVQRKELAAELASINNMMEQLDTQKQDLIERTFKQVQHEFESVFKELVRTNGAKAELLLVPNPNAGKARDARKKKAAAAAAGKKKAGAKKGNNTNNNKAAKKGKRNANDDDDPFSPAADAAMASDDEDDDDDDEQKAAANEDPFIAVKIAVCFGLGQPVHDLAQLSGGQKSLVALSLIFAIQRSDPAPFYLFDEIDAALDPEYRTNVAKMLQKQSEKCQFVTVSFKTEMLEVADAVYRIEFMNKVSKIVPIEAQDGVQVLKQQAAEDKPTNKDQGTRRRRGAKNDDDDEDG